MVIFTRTFETDNGLDKNYGMTCLFETNKISAAPLSATSEIPTNDWDDGPSFFVLCAWVGLGNDAWPRAITPPIPRKLAEATLKNIQMEMGHGNHINMVSMYTRNDGMLAAVSKYDTRQKLREQAADNEQKTKEQKTNEQAD